MARQPKKGGEKPLIETESERIVREAAAKAAAKQPTEDKAETKVPAKTEELEFSDKSDEDDKEKEPVQTGNATWNAVKAFWNRLGEFEIEINI